MKSIFHFFFVYAPFLLQNRIFNYKREMPCSKFKGLSFTIGSGILRFIAISVHNQRRIIVTANHGVF